MIQLLKNKKTSYELPHASLEIAGILQNQTLKGLNSYYAADDKKQGLI